MKQCKQCHQTGVKLRRVGDQWKCQECDWKDGITLPGMGHYRK